MSLSKSERRTYALELARESLADAHDLNRVWGMTLGERRACAALLLDLSRAMRLKVAACSRVPS